MKSIPTELRRKKTNKKKTGNKVTKKTTAKQVTAKKKSNKKVTAKKKSNKRTNDNGAVNEARSVGIAQSWEDPKVAKARKARNKVKVGNTVYRSVRKAFEDLKLPDKDHQKFRKELFQTKGKKATFTTDKGKKLTFTVVNE